VRAAVTRDVPDEALSLDALVATLRTIAFEHSTYVGHPGFMAYISGAGTVPGAAADLLAAALNQNVAGWRLSPGATELELHLGGRDGLVRRAQGGARREGRLVDSRAWHARRPAAHALRVRSGPRREHARRGHARPRTRCSALDRL